MLLLRLVRSMSLFLSVFKFCIPLFVKGQVYTPYLLYSSFQRAKQYVESALDYSKDILIGEGHQGPFDHLLKLKNNALNQCVPRPFDPNSLLLYAVTDSNMNKKWGRSISDAVQAAIEGGATIVQLRFDLKATAPFSSRL